MEINTQNTNYFTGGRVIKTENTNYTIRGMVISTLGNYYSIEGMVINTQNTNKLLQIIDGTEQSGH